MLFARRRAALEEDLASPARTGGLVRRELRTLTPLLRDGDVSEAEVLKLRRQAAATDAQRTTRSNQYVEEVQTKLAQAEGELAGAREMRAQHQDALDQTRLFAPMGDGVVAGEEVLQIVPDGDELVVEAKVRPADIGHMRPDLPAQVKIDAYDFTVYGALDGERRGVRSRFQPPSPLARP